MGRQHDTVSFLTDYGLDDEFVGVVKSVIRDMAPHVAHDRKVVHDIAQRGSLDEQDLRHRLRSVRHSGYHGT